MKRVIDWVRGWVVTIDIYLHNRELYDILRQPLNGNDFGEVRRPGE